jgi:proprotein convertase subtilisin/kexin type 5
VPGAKNRNTVPPCGCKTGYGEFGFLNCEICHVRCQTCKDAYENCVSCKGLNRKNNPPDCNCSDNFYE